MPAVSYTTPRDTMHNAATGHPIITSFQPGERWFYDYRTEEILHRPEASRSSLASVGSTGAGTGRSGAFKLANAASRIGDGFLVSDPGVTRLLRA